MSEIPDELAGKAEVLRELSRDGGPLSPDAAGATIHQREWFVRGAGGEPEPTPQRRELHGRLLAQYDQEHGRGEVGYKAIMLAGPPGAGKGSIRDQVTEEAAQRFTVVDPDEFKVLLIRAAVEDGSIERMMPPEAAARGVELAPMELAALVHEESSMLAGHVRNRAIRAGENVVLDSVLSNEDKAIALAGRLAGAGYDVQVVDVEVPAEVSRQRIAQRWVEQTRASELGGRWVPSEFRESVFDAQGGASSRCEQAARAVAERVPEVSRYRRYYTTAEQALQEHVTPRLTDDLHRASRNSPLLPAVGQEATTELHEELTSAAEPPNRPSTSALQREASIKDSAPQQTSWNLLQGKTTRPSLHPAPAEPAVPTQKPQPQPRKPDEDQAVRHPHQGPAAPKPTRPTPGDRPSSAHQDRDRAEQQRREQQRREQQRRQGPSRSVT